MQSLQQTVPTGVAPTADLVAEMTITARLRFETRAEHEAIEKNVRLKRLMADDLTRAEYLSLLIQLVGFYKHVEAGLHRWSAHFPAPLELSARLGKTELLLKDIEILAPGFRMDGDWSQAGCGTFTSIEQAWGYLYVVEGSTLGGQLIARNLKATIGVTAETGARFHSPYGALTGARWQTFKTILTDEVARGALETLAIVTAASGAFKALDAWLTVNP